MSHQNSRNNNLVGQVLLFLLAIGLYLVADDDDNHWSVRIACGGILVVIPLAYCFGLAGSALESATNANDLTDSTWGLAL